MIDTPYGFPPQRTPALLRNLMTELGDTADIRREEAITGRLADPVAALDGRIGEALSIERALESIAGYRSSIALAETRAQATQAVFEQIRGLTDDLANQAQVALENQTTGGLEIASTVAGEALFTLTSALNTRVGGRSIFAGNAGDSPAIVEAGTILAEVTTIVEAAPNAGIAAADLRAAFDDAGGLFETALYLGGNGDAPSAEVAAGERVDHGARADDPAIRDLLRAVAALATAYDPDAVLTGDDRRKLAESAVRDLRDTVEPINRLSARVGVAEARIETVKARHVTEEAALTRSYNALTGADTLLAASHLQEVEGQIEVLFLTTARLANLSLVNFLR
ncbi:hypothetical protein LNKW23_30680 [Paralimibaculum aggregatum]|uniref:Flagellin n=1 Tax=Paralimibaculum aggregatum TaxID=3036245 RepID=A0ABQ6LKV1_9RHOB|nr:hypothetical protein [Limibaculum sp. NKW23]GMG83854.1 hypothetical protein LNKW23_30680 [Limibaculum sp. NKW23]